MLDNIATVPADIFKTERKSIMRSSCGKEYSWKKNMINHVLTQHSQEYLIRNLQADANEKQFKCLHCEKRFANKNDCEVHLQTHTKERPFECTYCDKRFSLKRNCERHSRTHTKEKPFECTYCDKKFSRKDHLNSHLKMHRDAIGEAPHKFFRPWTL